MINIPTADLTALIEIVTINLITAGHANKHIKIKPTNGTIMCYVDAGQTIGYFVVPHRATQ